MFNKPLKKVMIVVPTDANITSALVPKLIKWSSLGAEVVVVVSSPLIDHARNMGVRHFLKSKKEYLLFIDSDTLPDVDGPQRLLKHKKDIVGGVYSLLVTDKDGNRTTRPSAFEKVFVDRPLTEAVPITRHTGMTKVDVIATGFLLIHRKALEKIPEPWFEFVWLDKEHTQFHGEDVAFSHRAIENGIDIWCDTDAAALHSKTINI